MTKYNLLPVLIRNRKEELPFRYVDLTQEQAERLARRNGTNNVVITDHEKRNWIHKSITSSMKESPSAHMLTKGFFMHKKIPGRFNHKECSAKAARVMCPMGIPSITFVEAFIDFVMKRGRVFFCESEYSAEGGKVMGEPVKEFPVTEVHHVIREHDVSSARIDYKEKILTYIIGYPPSVHNICLETFSQKQGGSLYDWRVVETNCDETQEVLTVILDNVFRSQELYFMSRHVPHWGSHGVNVSMLSDKATIAGLVLSGPVDPERIPPILTRKYLVQIDADEDLNKTKKSIEVIKPLASEVMIDLENALRTWKPQSTIQEIVQYAEEMNSNGNLKVRLGLHVESAPDVDIARRLVSTLEASRTPLYISPSTLKLMYNIFNEIDYKHHRSIPVDFAGRVICNGKVDGSEERWKVLEIGSKALR